MDRRMYELSGIYKMQTPSGVSAEIIKQNRSKNGYCAPSPGKISDDILTMSFVNMQPLKRVYPNDTAFESGTLFPDIDKPFSGGKYRDK